MFTDIDLSKEIQKAKLSLCKPNKTTLCNLPEAYNTTLDINLSTLDELTFSIPCQIDVDIEHKIERNPHVDLIRNRYLIKLVLSDYIQWFVITSPIPSADDDSDYFEINCVSLENELNNKRLHNYNVSAVKLSEIMNGFTRDTTIITNGISATTTVTTDGIFLKSTMSLLIFHL